MEEAGTFVLRSCNGIISQNNYMKERVIRICEFLTDLSIVSILLVVPVFFSFIYETWNIFELPKLVAFRYLLGVGVLSWVALVFIRGGFKHRATLALMFLSGILLISWLSASLASIHPQLSFWGKYQRLQGFSSFLSYMVFFWLCFLHIDSWRKIKMCLWAIVASSVLVCFYGTSQFLYLDPMNWAESFENFRRIFSTLGQPNFLGHYLVMVIPISAYCLLFLSKKVLTRFLLALLLLLQIVCLYYTWSRSAWLALSGEFWLASLFFLAVKGKKRLFLALIGVSALVILSLGALFLVPKDANSGFWLKNRWISSFDLSVGSQKMRLVYATGAAKEYLGATWKRKIFGYGQDTLSDVTGKWYEKDWGNYEKINTWPDRIHNFFFDALLTVGAFGVLSSLAFFLYFLSLAIKFFRQKDRDRRYWLAVFLAVSIFGYFINDLFSFPMTPQYVYFYFFLAVLSIIFLSRHPEKEVAIRLAPLSKILIGLALAFFLGVFVFYKGAMAMKADYYFAASRDWSGSNNCQALEFNRLASILNPEENFYREEYIFNALNCFDAIDDQEQKVVLKENVDIVLAGVAEKEKWYFIKLEEANVYSVYAANIDESYGDKAEEYFSDLIEEYPNINQIYLYYAYHKLRRKDYSSVVELVDKAESLMPKLTLPLFFLNNIHRQTLASELVRFYELAAVASELSGDKDRAIEYYTKVIKADPYRLLAYKRLSDVYYTKGDIDSALRYNQRGYSLNRHDPSWPLAISLLLDDRGDGAGALDYASQVLKLDPENEEAKKIKAKYQK
jgi:putative inorganic carbon (hco3(-)) transporter